jgi:hypothetical protein
MRDLFGAASTQEAIKTIATGMCRLDRAVQHLQAKEQVKENWRSAGRMKIWTYMREKGRHDGRRDRHAHCSGIHDDCCFSSTMCLFLSLLLANLG